jgi:hypothetical protein
LFGGNQKNANFLGIFFGRDFGDDIVVAVYFYKKFCFISPNINKKISKKYLVATKVVAKSLAGKNLHGGNKKKTFF